MKTKLLLGVALFTTLSTHAQTTENKRPVKLVNMAQKLAAKYDLAKRASEHSTPSNSQTMPIGPAFQMSSKSASTSVSWKLISGSLNIYGVLEISGKPLHYNNELNAVSFIHRKSFTYISNPVATPSTAASGVIVGMVSANCGTDWDSTCIWNNNTNWARYPQGGFWNPPGNTTLSNAHLVVSGPVTAATGSWVGSYLASKKLDAIGGLGNNNVASTLTGAQQFEPNAVNINTVLGKFDYPSYSFSSTDDGKVHSLGIIVNDFNGTGSARQYRGARVLTGTVSPGQVVQWSSDSVIVAPLTKTNTAGDSQLLGEPHMAWNESGTVGYVVHFGCLASATNPINFGFQPIIYRYSVNSPTWTLMPPIDFSLPQFQNKVLKRIPSTTSNTDIAIPFFNTSEGIDCVVDKNDKLHIVSTLFGSAASETSSLGVVSEFVNADGDTYSFGHVAGLRPYIYDFMETSTGWNVAIIDSMSSEAPGERSADDGYNENPWDPTGGGGTDKVSSAARIQASRTPDGRFIVYTWAESDTSFTSGGKKWNNIPNIKARAFDVDRQVVSLNEINLTSSTDAPLISTRAQMHHVSPTCQFVSIAGVSAISPFTYTVDVKVPVTVTTNQNTPLTQEMPNDHWYSCAQLAFRFPDKYIDPSEVGLTEKNINTLLNGVLFPNPASKLAYLKLDLVDASVIQVQVINHLGQVITNFDTVGKLGENTIELNLNGASEGIYIVKIKIGNSVGTKKLIVE